MILKFLTWSFQFNNVLGLVLGFMSIMKYHICWFLKKVRKTYLPLSYKENESFCWRIRKSAVWIYYGNDLEDPKLQMFLPSFHRLTLAILSRYIGGHDSQWSVLLLDLWFTSLFSDCRCTIYNQHLLEASV